MQNLINVSNQKWWILAAMSIVLAMAFIDQTAIAVTLPGMQRLFNATTTQLQWVVDIYVLCIAVLVIIGGRLGDLFTHRRVFLIGLMIFMLASIFCGSVGHITWLIIFRALQGIGAALIIPSSTVLALNAFAPHERGKAMGMSVGFASFFLAIGPTLGGVFTQLLSWRLVFWINVPLSIIAIVIIRTAVEYKPSRASSRKLDVLGLITLIIATASLVTVLLEGNNLGWDSDTALGLFFIAIIFFAGFYYAEKTADEPLIDFAIFRQKTFLAAALVLFCIQIALMTMVFYALFNQQVLDFTPAIAGLLALPSTLPVMFMAPLGGSLLDKYGPRLPVVTGLALTALGLLLNGWLVRWQNFLYLLPGGLCTGFGVPLVMSPVSTAALTAIDKLKQGMASGMLNAVRQLGACIGLALLSAIIVGSHQHNLAQFLKANKAGYPVITLKQMDGLLANKIQAAASMTHLTAVQLNNLRDIAKASFTSAFSLGLYMSSGFLLIALVAALGLLTNASRQAAGDIN